MESSSNFSHALSVLFIFHLFLATFMGSTLAITKIEYIKMSCSTTMYTSFCYNSISKYSYKIQTNPKSLATTALSIALASTQSYHASMQIMSKSRGLNPRETMAMNDCLKLLSDASDMIMKSMKEMDQAKHGPGFDFQMSNVQTWVSAALTDDDTCMDGFKMKGVRDNVKAIITKRVSNALQMKSISLTFINDYANN